MDEHTPQTANINTIDFRLSQIESSLQDVKDLLVSVKLANKDISELQDDVAKLEQKVQQNADNILLLKNLPDKKSAERWQYIVDYVFKFFVGGIAAYIATKIGLPH